MAATVPSVELYNGYKMPTLGLGTLSATDAAVEAAVEAALEAGYRHIDTAYSYGNEAAIGKVLKKWLDSGKVKREELFIVTKLPGTGNRAESVTKHIKKSLEGLQLSYVDLYLVHSPWGFRDEGRPVPLDQRVLDPSTDHLSVWRAMEAQVDAGRARSIGLSNFNARQIKRIVQAARIRPANLQVELNVYFQQRELVAYCKALDITVCAFAPLFAPAFFGRLSQNGRIPPEKPQQSPIVDPVVVSIAKKHGKTPAQVLLKHIVQRGIIAIPKSANSNRIKENIQVFDFQLDEDDMNKLYRLDYGPVGRVHGGNMKDGLETHPEYGYREPY